MPRWKLGFSTNAYTRFTAEEAIERIAKHGYEGAELLADRPHAFPADLTRDGEARIEQAFRNAGLACANVNANTAAGHLFPEGMPEPVFEPGLANPDPHVRERRIAHTEGAIRLAERLDAPNVSITTGRALPGAPPERAWLHLLDALDPVLHAAEDAEVRVGIEYEPGLLVENARELQRLIRDAAHPALGANLDLGHTWVNGERLGDTIHALADRLWHVHLEDIRGRKHYHLVPGDGDLPFREVFDALDDIRYDGFVTLELYPYIETPDEAAARALDGLAEFT